MSKSFFYIIITLVLSYCSPKSQSLIYRQDVFENNLSLISEENSIIEKAVDILRIKSDEVIKKDIKSVTFKEKTPPGGTKNDYWSIAPYWWPDPNKSDGLPYINKDGMVNPESKSVRDKEYLYELFVDMELMGLAYVYFKDEKYVDHAVKILKAWFINDETKMNTNLNFGQSIPGVNNGRITGIIDTRGLMHLLESVLVSRNSPNWDRQIDHGLNIWVDNYLNRMLHSELRKKAKNLPNNIGTAYNNQVINYN